LPRAFGADTPIRDPAYPPATRKSSPADYVFSFKYAASIALNSLPWLTEQVTEPLLTCEPVLAQAAFHLQSCPP
jgi:hypothetical protein